MLEHDDGFMSSIEIGLVLEAYHLKLDGVSAHCPFWVHGSAWTETKGVWPFLPEGLRGESVEVIEAYAENYLRNLFDLCAELGVKVMPMFWGLYWGPEVASGYPWPFWKGPGYDLIAEGDERFVEKTARLRRHAHELGIHLAHEIHPGTAAQTAEDFCHLYDLCDGDEVIAVNADPSHCWEGEPWLDRLELTAPFVYGAHVKNHHVRPSYPRRCMAADWTDRPVQFTALDQGDIDLVRYVEELLRIGYDQRYCGLMGTETAPLVVEAEAAYRDLDDVSAAGIRYVRDQLCFPLAGRSFEEGMGVQD